MTPDPAVKLGPRFLNHLIADADQIPYTLTVPLLYISGILDGQITVPAGFSTDLASIPQFLQNLIPKEGRYNRPAVVHDYLYGSQVFKGRMITRKQADQVLLEAMRAAGVDWDRAQVIYLGVRIGGWIWWGKRAKELKAKQAAAHV